MDISSPGLEFLVEYILISFAIYRFSRMLAIEEGPFEIFLRLRLLVDPQQKQSNWFTRGIACPICLGFWVSFIVTLAIRVFYQTDLRLDFLILLWFGLSGLSTYLYMSERQQ